MGNQSKICEWIASDGYRIKYRFYQAEGSRKGIIVALHGIQSHSGWYEFSSQFLAKAGYDVFFLDRRGSGLNSSQRGHSSCSERLIQDVIQFIHDCRFKNHVEDSNSPIYLSGLSWGGKLASVVAGRIQDSIDGLILLYPGICAKIRPSWIQKKLLNLSKLDRLRFRTAKIPLDDPALFTHEENWQQWIENDPISLREATISFFQSSIELDQLSQNTPNQFRKPVLLMLAGKDRIIDNASMKDYFEQIKTPLKKMIEYPDAAHTLEFELNRELIYSDLLKWLDENQLLPRA